MSDKLFLMPLDWDALLADEKVIAMSDQAFRAYMHLLRAAWQSDNPASLPDNDSFLARVSGMGLEAWKQVRQEIVVCFRVSNGRWHQKKMRQVYDDVIRRRKLQSDKGKAGAAKRWEMAQALAQASPEQCPGIGNQIQNQNQNENYNQSESDSHTSAEPDKPASAGAGQLPLGETLRPVDPIVMVFPTSGPTHEWGLRASKVTEWRTSYPLVDVDSALRELLQWCVDNPRRRKTARGMTSFLSRCLAKRQNRGAVRQDGPASQFAGAY